MHPHRCIMVAYVEALGSGEAPPSSTDPGPLLPACGVETEMHGPGSFKIGWLLLPVHTVAGGVRC